MFECGKIFQNDPTPVSRVLIRVGMGVCVCMIEEVLPAIYLQVYMNVSLCNRTSGQAYLRVSVSEIHPHLLPTLPDPRTNVNISS